MSTSQPPTPSSPRTSATKNVWPLVVGASFAIGLLRANTGFQVLPSNVWLVIQLVVLLIGIAATLVAGGGVRGLRTVSQGRKVAMAALALTAFCALSTLWSQAPSRSLSQSVVLAIGLTFLFLTATLRWRGGVPRTDLTFLFALVVVTLVLSIFVRLLGLTIATGVAGRLQGLTGNPNYLGMLLTVGVALLASLLVQDVSPRGLLVLAVAGGAIGATMLWSGSRGAILAAGVTTTVALFSDDLRIALKARWRTLLAGGALGALVCLGCWAAAQALEPPAASTAYEAGVGPTPGSAGSLLDRGAVDRGVTTGRGAIWSAAVGKAADRPLVGYGFRTSEVMNADGLTTHNILLAFLVETGVVGLSLFVLLLATLVVMGWTRHPLRIVLLAGFVGVLVQEQLEASLQAVSGPLALMQWLLIFAFAASGAATREADVKDDAGAST